MSLSSQGKGQVITFYSYKGGVGRSMALVNVGVLLARGEHKVLLVDWDLEAPGLVEYFKSPMQCVLSSDYDMKPGVVDLLLETDRDRGTTWQNCLTTAKFPGGKLDIISAGRRDKNYQENLRKLDWGVLYESYHIGDFIEEMRSELKDNYDFILIDSRTGITDIGDICTVLLPDTLITIFTSNNQNIDGCETVVERARAARRKLPVNRNKLIVVPLASRDESDSEYEQATVWRERFASRFKKYLSEWLPHSVTPEEYFNRIYIPYVPVWSFGERIPVLESKRELKDPKTIGASYLAISRMIENELEWFSPQLITELDDLKSKQVEIRVAEESYDRLSVDQIKLQDELHQLNVRLESTAKENWDIARTNKSLEEQLLRQKNDKLVKNLNPILLLSVILALFVAAISFSLYTYNTKDLDLVVQIETTRALLDEVNSSRLENEMLQEQIKEFLSKIESRTEK